MFYRVDGGGISLGQGIDLDDLACSGERNCSHGPSGQPLMNGTEKPGSKCKSRMATDSRHEKISDEPR